MAERNQNILIVDDDESVCSAYERFLTGEGYTVRVTPTAEEGLDAARESKPDLLLLDIKLPGMDGLEALRTFRDRYEDLPVLLITAYGTLDTAVRAREQGAFEYLTKPIDLDELSDVIKRALEPVTDDHDIRSYVEEGILSSDAGMVGKSSEMQEVFSEIARLSSNDTTVFITGETGTGKELAARAIHENSDRNDEKFLPVDCASLSEQLIESELYGHEKGAFTGADERSIGKLEAGDGGTVFLDEITELPPDSQAKLLRFLEHRTLYRVGGSNPIEVDVRVIAATNRDVEELIRLGQFREDLYYRLNVSSLEMPPLRHRKEDIPVLVFAFLRELGEEQHSVPEETMEMLRSYSWPGNVRQLRNATRHAVSKSPGSELQPGDFPEEVRSVANGNRNRFQRDVRTLLAEQLDHEKDLDESDDLYDQFLQPVERMLLKEVLERTEFNITRASRALGITRTTLRKKARQFGIIESAGEDHTDRGDA